MRDNLSACFVRDTQGCADGRHSRRECNCGFTTLRIGQMFLEHAPRRFVQTVINVNRDVSFDVCFVGSKFDKTLCAAVH